MKSYDFKKENQNKGRKNNNLAKPQKVRGLLLFCQNTKY